MGEVITLLYQETKEFIMYYYHYNTVYKSVPLYLTCLV